MSLKRAEIKEIIVTNYKYGTSLNVPLLRIVLTNGSHHTFGCPVEMAVAIHRQFSNHPLFRKSYYEALTKR